jgi:multidrug transporter EmrE-like cation transporter
LGKVFFDDPVPPLAMVGMVLIVGGVALVSFSGAPGH